MEESKHTESVPGAEERKSIFKSILGATVALELGQGLQRGIFNNFVVEVVGIEPAQLGLVQGIREIPGLLTAPLATVQGFFRENTYAAVCLLATALGVFMHTMAVNFPLLILATLVMSTGFHLFYPVQSSIVMKTCLPEERATKVGQLNSAGSAGALVSVAIVIVMTRYWKTDYAFLHTMAAAFTALGGLAVLRRSMGGKPSGRTAMNFNPRYMSYYILTFLGGSRRHITQTFAGYLLVEVYGTSVSTMVLLSAISSMVAIVTRPLVGKTIDRWGEQKSLIVNYGLVIGLFACYALLKQPLLLFTVYVLDHGLMGFDAAITTYMGRIAPKEVLSSAYAMGQTVNHLSGVSVPVLGGYLWDLFGPGIVFAAGAAIAGVSLVYSMSLDRRDSALASGAA
ncbi:MAG: MFS transporter [Bacillota bacterium]|jgi:predicted MFS family arabinose efflux permease